MALVSYSMINKDYDNKDSHNRRASKVRALQVMFKNGTFSEFTTGT